MPKKIKVEKRKGKPFTEDECALIKLADESITDEDLEILKSDQHVYTDKLYYHAVKTLRKGRSLQKARMAKQEQFMQAPVPRGEFYTLLQQNLAQAASIKSFNAMYAILIDRNILSELEVETRAQLMEAELYLGACKLCEKMNKPECDITTEDIMLIGSQFTLLEGQPIANELFNCTKFKPVKTEVPMEKKEVANEEHKS
jgi:hypothetical protein